MDPRKPELVVPRIDELVEQFKKVLTTIKTAKTSHAISDAEREGVMVVREICLTAPRLQETLIQASRNRRIAMAHGLVDVEEEPQETEEEEVKNEEEIISDDGGEMGEERGEEEEATEGETEEKNGEEKSEAIPEETTVVENLVETPLEEEVEKNIENATSEAKSEVKEIYVPPNQAETIIVEPNYHKKKKSRGKK